MRRKDFLRGKIFRSVMAGAMIGAFLLSGTSVMEAADKTEAVSEVNTSTKRVISSKEAERAVLRLESSADSYKFNKKKSATSQLKKIFRTTELQDATVDSLQKAMKSGRLTSEQLVNLYIDRIKAYDEKKGINSVISINPSAVSDAKKLDKERKKKKVRGPLHGIPIIVKDNYDVAGMATSAGSLTLNSMIATKDSFTVKKLKEAGAVIIARANMSEFAMSAVDSESLLGGVVYNPYDLLRTPAGSSGGTAVAVTCNFATVGLGTDTGGSIRYPSCYNNIYGIRPSKGLTSITGVVPLAAYKDTTGPMARTAKDMAYVLQAMAGTDKEDTYTVEADADKLLGKGYTSSLSKNGLKGKKIGYFTGSFEKSISEYDEETSDEEAEPEISWSEPHDEVKAIIKKARANLRKAGAELVCIDDWLNIWRISELQEQVWEDYSEDVGMVGNFEYDMNSYLARFGENAPYKTLKDIVDTGYEINFQNINVDTDFADSLDTTPNPYTYDVDGYKRHLLWRKMKEIRETLTQEMKEHGIDAIMYLPSMGVASQADSEEVGSQYGDGYIWLFGPLFGMPEVNIPMGLSNTSEEVPNPLPSGFALFAGFGQDKTLMEMSYAYQLQAGSFIRKSPSITPALKDKKLNSYLSALIKQAAKINVKKKNKTAVKLMQQACVDASRVDVNKPSEVYKLAKRLAKYYDML